VTNGVRACLLRFGPTVTVVCHRMWSRDGLVWCGSTVTVVCHRTFGGPQGAVVLQHGSLLRYSTQVVGMNWSANGSVVEALDLAGPPGHRTRRALGRGNMDRS
jgi:hypothetical protein